MKNKDIKDTFESFSPSEERKETIYESIVNKQESKDEKTKLRFSIKLAYSLIAFIILVSVAAIMLKGPTNDNDISLIESDNTQYNQAGKPSENSGFPTATDKKKIFRGFALTAYAADSEAEYLNANFLEEAEKLLLTPDIKIPLAKYTPLMSSVPGLPFTVDLAGDDNINIEAINISADYGELNKWNRETGVVSSQGQSATIDTGETIYWSPITDEDFADIKNAVITVEAVADGKVAGRQKLYITQKETGYYYATAGELELPERERTDAAIYSSTA